MTAGPVQLLAVVAALAAAGIPAAGAQEQPARQRFAQAGPLVLPGAMPAQPTPPAPAAEPDDSAAPPAAPRGAAPRARTAPTTSAPRRAAPKPSPAARAEPPAPPPPPPPAPEALPGFEHLAPPPAAPAPVPAAAADPAKAARGKAARKGQPPVPAEPAAPSPEDAVPLADDRPVPATPAPVVVLPSSVSGAFQPMVLSDAALLTRRRLLLADAPPLAAPAAAAGRPVRTNSAASVPPLYAPMAFVPGTERVYDPHLAASDAIEALPLALNSVEALREGIPVGPFRAGLIEDNPGGSPRIETGTVVWQVDGDPAVTAERGPSAIRATASIGRGPARVVLTLRHEPVADGSGPLSMELQVEMPGDAVVQAGIPEMRNSGIDRGVALYATVAGDAARVRFAFADNASDGEQNVRMLSQRSWIDLPVRLRSGRKVVFALEKGTAVRDIMREAFRLWRLPWLP